MVLDVVAIPAPSMSGSISSQSEEFGTADAIRHIHDKLKANRIMIISSDLITDVQVLQISIFDLTTSEIFLACDRKMKPILNIVIDFSCVM